ADLRAGDAGGEGREHLGPLGGVVVGRLRRGEGDLVAVVRDAAGEGLPLVVGEREQQPEDVPLAHRDEGGEPGQEVGQPAGLELVAAPLHGGHSADPRTFRADTRTLLTGGEQSPSTPGTTVAPGAFTGVVFTPTDGW